MAAGVNVHAMNTEPRVREAHCDEAGLLQSIFRYAFSEYDGRLDPPSGVHSETVASVENKVQNGGALVCEVGGIAIGCMFYEPKAGYLYVGRLAVLPEYRRQGIEDLLLRAAERRAAELGFSHVRLGVRIVLEKLRAYYAAREYVPIAFRSHAGYKEPTYVEMEKALRDHATN